MISGILLGIVVLALIILYYTDEDRSAFPIFIITVLALILISVVIGYEAPKQYEVKQQVKPSIKVITVDGKSDTTYIYKFEEEK